MPEPNSSEYQTTYRDAGVDIEAHNRALAMMKAAVQATYTPQVVTGMGAFGGMFAPDLSGYREPVLVASIDGVGTKLKIAGLMARHDTIGRDLVAHCINDIAVQGAAPLFFLDYIATGRLAPEVVAEIVEGLAAECREAGCVLLGGETAELPGLYPPGEYEVAGCIVGLVERSEIIDGRHIVPGDLLLGLSSSGLHTNGYSLVRKVLLEDAGLSVHDWVPELGTTLGEELLKPHRCYLSAIQRLRQECRVKGLAHITGGSFFDNLPRILPPGTAAVVDPSAWEPQPIFRLVAKRGRVPQEEMYRTFNMGIGMVAVVAPAEQETAQRCLTELGLESPVIGEIVAGERTVTLTAAA